MLHQDEHLIAVHKPAGFHVHPPESGHLIPDGANCLKLLRKQADRYLYPVHRLDRATSGVLLFALDPVSARDLMRQFDAGEVEKTYYAVVRGWPPETGVIDDPLRDKPGPRFPGRSDGGGADAPDSPVQAAVTEFERLAALEVPRAVGRHDTARYALLRVRPRTGRWHQVRRHLARRAHPVLGDTAHGDRAHNRFARDELGLEGLLLKAHAVTFSHPGTGERVRVVSPWKDLWHRVFEHFGLCPWGDGRPGLHRA
ncbi:MAG: pseudouridylate synthase [Acidobacteria bacterium]|nr:pseudouridylate synthase [Acidobacteriota bacterium]